MRKGHEPGATLPLGFSGTNIVVWYVVDDVEVRCAAVKSLQKFNDKYAPYAVNLLLH